MPSEGLISFVQVAERSSLPSGYLRRGGHTKNRKQPAFFHFSEIVKTGMLWSFVRLQKKTQQAEAEKAAACTGKKTHDHIKGNSQTFAVDLRS